MTKSQQRNVPPESDIHSALFTTVKRKSNGKIWWLAVPVFLLSSFFFIRAKAPEPLDLNKVLNATPQSSDYTKEDIDFLAKAGLSNSSTVRKNVSLMDGNIKELVQKKYGLNYIAEKEFEENILMKYNLVIAPLTRYERSVPKKNLIELKENLEKIKKADEQDFKVTDASGFVIMADERVQNALQPISLHDIRPDWASGMINNTLLGGGIQWASSALTPTALAFYRDKYPNANLAVAWLPGHKSFTVSIPTGELNLFDNLTMCAPPSYFNLEGLELSHGSMFEWIVPPPKDPIIMKRYKNGYIILTAWDE